MPALHGSRENHASQFARGDRRQRTIKEDPNVAALPGTRTLQGSGHVQLLAGLKKSQGVILPRLLVEVCREKPARFVGQEGIHANGFLAQEVVLDDGVGQREELPCLLVDFLPILRTASVDGLPVLYGRRHISVTGHRHSPIAVRRHLLSRETGFETARFSFWHAPPCPPVAPSRRFWLEADSLAPVAESECCEPPEAAAGEHSPRGDEYFPALEVRMEEILNRSRSYRVHRSVRRASTSSRNSCTPANTAATSVGSPHSSARA